MKLNNQKTNSVLKSLWKALFGEESTADHEPALVGVGGLSWTGDLPYDRGEGWRAGWETWTEWPGKICGAQPSGLEFLQHQLVCKELGPPPGSAEV